MSVGLTLIIAYFIAIARPVQPLAKSGPLRFLIIYFALFVLWFPLLQGPPGRPQRLQAAILAGETGDLMIFHSDNFTDPGRFPARKGYCLLGHMKDHVAVYDARGQSRAGHPHRSRLSGENIPGMQTLHF